MTAIKNASVQPQQTSAIVHRRNPGQSQQSQTISIETDRLSAYPLQGEIYAPCTPEEDALLEKHIRAGTCDPLVVMPAENVARLPANTILDGHRRWVIAQKLGIKEVLVVVRFDLKDASHAEVDSAFLEINFSRRQLDAVGQTRVIIAAYEREKGKSREKFDAEDRAELRRRISKFAHTVPRNAGRYLNLCLAPLAIQLAVSTGRLTLREGERAALLPNPLQAGLVASLAWAADRRAAKGAYSRTVGVGHDDGTGRVRQHDFTAMLERAIRVFSARAVATDKMSPADCELLRKARELIDRVLARGEDERAASHPITEERICTGRPARQKSSDSDFEFAPLEVEPKRRRRR